MQRPSPNFRSEEYSQTRYSKKLFSQIYRDLYGDAMLDSAPMSSNMADGNQQKHLLPSFATKSVNLFVEEFINIKVIFFVIHELST